MLPPPAATHPQPLKTKAPADAAGAAAAGELLELTQQNFWNFLDDRKGKLTVVDFFTRAYFGGVGAGYRAVCLSSCSISCLLPAA
jgi:hypothetical protein